MNNSNKLDKNLFKNPPKEYSPVAFWFWNGDLKAEEVNRQIDEMVDKGVCGGFMHARRALTTPYLTEEWWNIVSSAVEHSAKVGFNPWIYDEYAWPSGAAGATDRNSNQTYSKVLAEGEKNCAKGLNYIIRNAVKGEIIDLHTLRAEIGKKIVSIAAVKYISEKELDEGYFIDLTDEASWEVIEDNCKIFTFYQFSIENRVDYLNYDTIKSSINYTHEEYKNRYSKYFGNVIPGSFFDEIHNDGRPLVWTELFLQKFMEFKGYSLRKYLPLLICDGGKITDRIRCDYFDVLATLYEKAFFEQLSNWCGENNLMLTGHTEEWLQHQSLAQGHYFRTIRHLQIPGTDNHCFRYRHPRTINPVEAKVLSSVCHITGKERVMSEAMGGAGWAVTLDELKMGTDMLYAFGVNMLVPHGFHYTYDTPDGMDDWPPSWFFQNPYWKYFKKFADYISRLSYMGAGGKHHCKVVLLYPITSMWANTKDNKVLTSNSLWGTPTHVNNNEIIKHIADYYNNTICELVESQIDLDIIDEEYLQKSDIKNGKLSVSDEEYSVLVLPPLTTISKETAKKINEFYSSGGKIISIKMTPKASCENGREDEDVVSIFNRIFNIDKTKSYTVSKNNSNGKAYFISDDIKLIPELVEECSGRDFTIISQDKKDIYYMHKEKGGRHFYFVINTRIEKRKITVQFSLKGTPSLWDPEDGLEKDIAGYLIEEKRTTIELHFEPRQALYVVFDETGGAACVENAKSQEALPIDTIDLSTGWKYIAAPKELDKEWKCELNESHIEIPVAQYTWRHQPCCDDTKEDTRCSWELIKIQDKLSPGEGCSRYVSLWDGRWIAYRGNWRDDGQKKMYCRKEFWLDDISEINEAWFCLSAVSSYELYVNGNMIGKGSNWRNPDLYDIEKCLRQGKNVIAVYVERAEKFIDDVSGRSVTPESLMALLGEGVIKYTDNKEVKIITDSSWVCNIVEISGWQNVDFQYKSAYADIARNMWGVIDVPYGPRDTETWLNAWEIGRPPLKPFGNLPLKGGNVDLPIALWYKIDLPVGAYAIHIPGVRGDYTIYLNGKEIKQKNFIKEYYYLENQNTNNQLLIKVVAQSFNDGLIEPVKVLCKTFDLESLTPWNELNLNWYSGRGLYYKDIMVDEEQFNRRVKLNLGRVNFFAEVWVNGNLVDTRLWAPYEVDITSYLIKGENRIAIVVANLLANQMKWDMYDQVKAKSMNSYWHNENIHRDSQNLISGLLGPVRLLVE